MEYNDRGSRAVINYLCDLRRVLTRDLGAVYLVKGWPGIPWHPTPESTLLCLYMKTKDLSLLIISIIIIFY